MSEMKDSNKIKREIITNVCKRGVCHIVLFRERAEVEGDKEAHCQGYSMFYKHSSEDWNFFDPSNKDPTSQGGISFATASSVGRSNSRSVGRSVGHHCLREDIQEFLTLILFSLVCDLNYRQDVRIGKLGKKANMFSRAKARRGKGGGMCESAEVWATSVLFAFESD